MIATITMRVNRNDDDDKNMFPVSSYDTSLGDKVMILPKYYYHNY